MTNFFWDTNIFIYLFDSQGEWNEAARALRAGMIQRGIGMVTSTMTLGELQVGAKKNGNSSLAAQYRVAISQTATILSFDEPAADRYAEVRLSTSVRGPDAIQLACAASHGVELFVTNDAHLHKVRLPGIHFVVPMHTALGLVK